MSNTLFDTTIASTAEEAVAFITNILESSTEYSIIGKDLDGNIVLWNEGARRIYGYEPEEVIGKNGAILHTSDDVAVGKPYEILEAALQDGKWEGLLSRLRKNGEPFTARAVVTVRHDSEGQPIGFLFISKDISDEERYWEEQRQSEAALQESEELFEKAFRLSPDYVVIVRLADRTVVRANEALANLWGSTPKGIIGHPAKEYSTWLDEAERLAFMATLAEKGECLNYETLLRVPGGRVVPFVISSRIITVGNEPCVLSIMRDISERKQAEAERDRIFTMAVDILGVVGLDGEFKRVNPALTETLGFAEAELIGRHFIDWVHPEDRIATIAAFETTSGGNPVLEFENRYRTKGGLYRWLEWKGVPSLAEGVIYAAARDITERKNTEQALRKAKDELESRVVERTKELEEANESLRVENIERQMAMEALRETAEAFEKTNQALHNNEARLLQGNRLLTRLMRLRVPEMAALNPALQQITEAGSEILNAQRCSVWLYNDDHSVIECLDLYETAIQRHSQGVALAAQDFPGYFRALELGGIIVADDAHLHSAMREFSEPYLKPFGIVSLLDAPIIVGGQVVGMLCCERTGVPRAWQVDDQTFASSAAAICALALESYERTRTEVELRQARQEAVEANHAKSEFLSRMSHELRTPLNAILGFGQLLELRHGLTGEDGESVAHILKAGQHLLGLINEVLDIARIEAGHLSLSPEPIPVAQILPEVLDIVRPLAATRSIRLVNEVAARDERHLLADQQRFRQVLLNLLSNAIKYNREAGQVTLSCVGQNGFLRINVSDTGPGLTVTELQKLFVPFERLGAAASQVEGTGIGLVLCKRLAEAMDGRIGVDSTPGHGSVFWIELPLVESPIVQQVRNGGFSNTHLTEPSTADESGAVTAKFVILYIEDNVSNLRLIENILQARTDLKLLSAMQGSIGLELARQHLPDLILLDLHLPDISGEVVLRRLQAEPMTRTIPVIMLSADAMTHQITKLLEAGAKAYLTKPLNVREFLRTVEEFLAPLEE